MGSKQKHRFLVVLGALVMAGALGARPIQASEAPGSAHWEQDDPAAGRAYKAGTKALDSREWQKAVAAFDEVIAQDGERVDGALYWTAYALDKLGRPSEALAALDKLKRRFPNSRWLKEAQALEIEVRQAAGNPADPDQQADDELKLIAINALLHVEPERALPMIEKLLETSGSSELGEHALFVLSQSGSPRAREILASIVKGQRNPELRLEAIHYVAHLMPEPGHGPDPDHDSDARIRTRSRARAANESMQLLSETYAETTDRAVKQAILESFAIAGDLDRVLEAARHEVDEALRTTAIESLAMGLGALPAEQRSRVQQEMLKLYREEANVELKQALLRSMAFGGDPDAFIELARSETEPELRRHAIRHLGLLPEGKTAELLVSMYTSESDATVKAEIIQALALQQNAGALIDLARNETDRALRRQLVEGLTMVDSEEATDFLLELLEK